MAAIALKAKVPILPAAIVNSGTLPKKSGPVCVAFGELIMPEGNPSDKDTVNALTEKVRDIIGGMLAEHGGKS